MNPLALSLKPHNAPFIILRWNPIRFPTSFHIGPCQIPYIMFMYTTARVPRFPPPLALKHQSGAGGWASQMYGIFWDKGISEREDTLTGLLLRNFTRSYYIYPLW